MQALSVVSGSVALKEYDLQFNLSNPYVGQNSPSISVSLFEKRASSYALIMSVAVTKGAGNIAPLLIAGFIQQKIGAANTNAGVPNLITVTLGTRTTLPKGSQVTMSGFSGASAASQLRLSDAASSTALCGSSGCAALFSTNISGLPGYGLWDNTAKSLVIVLLNDSSTFNFIFSFLLTNPNYGQQAPSLFLSATGGQNVSIVPMTSNGTLKVIVILTKNISQSTPSVSTTNTILVALALSTTFGEQQLQITIAGLIGAQAVSGPLVLADASFDTSCGQLRSCNLIFSSGVGAQMGYGLWNNDSKTLQLYTNINALSPASNFSTRFSFNVTNPPMGFPYAPNISIVISGTTVYGSVSQINGTMISGSGNKAVMLIAFFLIKNASQSTSKKGSINTINVVIELNIAVPASTGLSVAGLLGSLTPDTNKLPISGSSFQNISTWYQSNGTVLVETSSPLSAYVVYSFSFQVTNPNHGQYASLLSIHLIFPFLSGVEIIFNFPGTTLAPLFVADFVSVPTIKQLYPFSQAANVISVVFIPNFNMTSIDNSTIFLSGIDIQLPSILYLLPGLAANGLSSGFEGKDLFGTSNGIGTCTFQDGIIALSVFASKQLSSNQTCAFSLNFTNPNYDHQAPKLNISASSSSSTVDFVRMQYPGQKLLSVSNGTDPFTVLVPSFVLIIMSQSTPLPGAHQNILTIQFQLNLDLYGNQISFAGGLLPPRPASVISLFGIFGAIAPESVQLLPVSEGNSAETLFSNGTSAGWGLWRNGTMTLNVINGSTVRSGVNYSFSFSVRNPLVGQSAPYISIGASGTATLPLVGLSRPNIALLGVANGTNPLEIEPPLFLNKSISQSYPFSGALNTLSVSISLNFNMYGADASVITITGLHGAIAGNSVLLIPATNGNKAETLFSNGTSPGWGSWDNGTLKLYVIPNSFLAYHLVYAFSFVVTNPSYSQSSPSTSIGASGTATVLSSAMVTPNLMLMGITNGSNPLEVVVPLFLNKSIVQSYPFSSELNVLTVAIALNFDLSGRDNSSITIHGLAGAVAPHSAQLLGEPDGNAGNMLFSNGTSAGNGLWNNGTLTLYVAAGAVVVHDVLYTFSFTVRNPPIAQSAPYTSMEASGTARIQLVASVRPNFMLMGVTNGSNPLEVIVPLFLNKSIVQSYPFSSELNVLTVAIALNFDLSGRDNSSITIHGLAGAVAPHSAQLLGEPDGNAGNMLFSNGTSAGNGLWNNGTLTLYVAAGAVVVHDVLYTFSFTVRNPPIAQSAPYTSIEAFGTAPIKLVGVQRPNSVLDGIINGTNPLETVVPQFTIGTMNQSNPTINEPKNYLTLRFRINFDLLGSPIFFRNGYLQQRNSSCVTISGIKGAISAGTLRLLSVSGGNSAESLFSNGTAQGWGLWSNGTLILYVNNGSTILNGVVYSLSISVKNPSVPQSAPYVSISATGTATIPSIGLTRPNLPLLGVISGLNPLEVIIPAFLNTSIAQTVPLISAYNTLSITMQLNIILAGSDGSILTISGLDWAILENSIPIVLEVEIGNQFLPYCSMNGSWSIGSDGSYSNTTMVIFDLPRNVTLFSYTVYRITFSVRNPPNVQKAPNVRALASGTAQFPVTLLHYTNESRLGVSFGANPLFIVEVVWLMKFISQSNPVSSLPNIIQVQLEPSCDIALGSTITVTGLTQSSTPELSLALNTQPAGIINTTAAWNQQNGSLTLYVLNMSAFSKLVFRFVLQNVGHDQNASIVKILGVVNIPIFASPIRSVYMDLSKGPLYGVEGGSSPLLTRVPKFYYAIMFQDNPASFVYNTITFQFRININLNWTDFSNITISGFSGLRIPNNIIQLLPVPGGNSGDLLFGFNSKNQGKAAFYFESTIVLQLFPGQVALSETEYQFAFTFLNPILPQDAVPLTISAMGSARYAPVLVQFLNEPRYGAPNGSNPLHIVATYFIKAAIAQSKPLAAYVNTIIVTLEMSLDLDAGSIFILSGFSPDAYPIRNPSNSPYMPLNLSNAFLAFKFMAVDGGNGGETLFNGFFNKGNVTFVLLPNKTVFGHVEYRFSFQILNPNRAQNAPAISIEAHGVNGTSNFARVLMAVPNQMLLGIPNGTNVLKLAIEPLFQHILMTQSNPLATFSNVINISFSVTFDLLGSDGSIITILGMRPSSILQNPVNLSSQGGNTNDSAASQFWYNGTRGLAEWDSINGTLFLHVGPNARIHAGVNYELEFTVHNPSYPQQAPAISICASGTAEFYLRAVNFINYTIFGVINGSIPLFIIIPRFEIAYMEQVTTLPGAVNLLTFIFRVNIEIANSNMGIITISGLNGATEDSSAIRIMNAPNTVYQGNPLTDAALKFQVKDESGEALWNANLLKGSLMLIVGTSGDIFKVGNVINTETTYGIQFGVTNSMMGQSSPAISVEASGGLNLQINKTSVTKGPGNLAPLLIAGFYVKYIQQSSPLQGALNTITISLSCYATLFGTFNSSGTNITITGLVGANTPTQSLVLGADARSLNCSGSWNQQQGSIIIRCFADILALQNYSFTFQILNPNSQRDPSPISISTNGVKIYSTLMTTGTNNERPLLVAGFLYGSILQSTPSASVANILQLNFSTSLAMIASDGVQMTLAGLRGTKAYSFQLKVLSGPFGSSAEWNFLSGVAVFTLNSSTPPRTNIIVSFVVVNSDGPRDPAAVTLSINGLGTFTLSSIDDNTAPLRTAGVLQSLMKQSTTYQNASNTLTLLLVFSCDLTVGTQLVISGLRGISNPSGLMPVSGTPPFFPKIASWNSTARILIVTIANQTLKNRNYTLSFTIINQMKGQKSPDISLFSQGVGQGLFPVLMNSVPITKASGIFAPLLIIGFEVNSIGQSTSRAHVINTLTVSISTYAPLPTGSQLTFSNLTTADKVPRACTVYGLSLNFANYFNLSAVFLKNGNLILSVFNQTNEDLIYIFSINVTNPTSQYSPAISNSATSSSVVSILPTEMTKATGIGAPLLVVLPPQLSQQCSNLSNWTQISSSTSFTPRQGFGVAMNGGLTLLGSHVFGNTALWSQDTGTIILQLVNDMYAGNIYDFSFELKNLSNSTSLLSINATGSATIGSQFLQSCLGVFNSSVSPPASVGSIRPWQNSSAWPLNSIQQSSPYPNTTNNITINISAPTNLTAAGNCAITLVGLSGTQTQSSWLPLIYPDSASTSIFGQSGQWDNSGVMSLTIAAGLTLQAWKPYSVTFQVLNPTAQRAAASVSIGASGFPSIEFTLMNSGDGLFAPLVVLGEGFSVGTIGQSTPLPGAQNTITCTVAATVAIQPGNTFLLFGLLGSTTADTLFLPITIVSLLGSVGSPLAAFATWKRAGGVMAVQIEQPIVAGKVVIFSFPLTNPGIQQQSPVPILAAVWLASVGLAPYDPTAAGPWLIMPQILSTDGHPPKGIVGAVGGDAAPLRVYSPSFTIASICEVTAPLEYYTVFTVTLSTNYNLTVAAGSRITLSGFIGSTTPDQQALYMAGGFDGVSFYNDVHSSSDGRSWTQLTANAGWIAREGHTLLSQNQTLYVIGGRNVNAQFSTAYFADVWASYNGITWSQVASAAPFPQRAFFGAVALGPLPSSGILVFGGITGSPLLRLNDVWISYDSCLTWTEVTASAQWAPRYGLAALTFYLPLSPSGGVYSLYTDSAGTLAILVAAGSTCSPGCGQYDTTLPGCAQLAGPAPQCCVLTSPCAVRTNLADFWVSTDSGFTWSAIELPTLYSPRTFPVAAVLPDRTVVIATGYDYYDHFTADLQILSASTGQGSFAQLTPVPTDSAGGEVLRRANSQMVVFKGCILLLGGHSRLGASQYTYYDDVWATG